MSLADLERNGLIKKFEPEKEETDDLLKLARRDIKIAKKIRTDDADWAYSIAYNAIIQTGRAWMLLKGWRPTGDTHHRAVVEFIFTTLGKGYEKLDYLETMRRKRHKVVYEKSGVVSETEVAYAIELAEFFLKKIRSKVKKI